ncbi:Zinc-binding protein [Vibrio rotiferianus]|uniref:zinc uptake protein ZrgA n=1 Tax=Vibrio rotiferianus TaxID=190895 RepID=UPI002894366B|nr:Zinc-binding protein [Vibrio rotiferianus]
MPSKHALALVIGLSLTATANAEEYRQHEAHVHGHVEFNIAQDGKDLLIEITSPGADVVGFEHAPENAEQEQALKQAIAALKDTGKLFAINKQAKCVIEDVHVSHTLSQDSHEGHDHHDHEGHDHDKHDHDGHEHDKHDHEKHSEHEGHDHEHGGHGEFTAEYRYHCDSVADLNSIDTTWFKLFPATESISVNLFTDTTQSATNLSKDNTKIAIK